MLLEGLKVSLLAHAESAFAGLGAPQLLDACSGQRVRLCLGERLLHLAITALVTRDACVSGRLLHTLMTNGTFGVSPSDRTEDVLLRVRLQQPFAPAAQPDSGASAAGAAVATACLCLTLEPRLGVRGVKPHIDVEKVSISWRIKDAHWF